MELVIDAVEVLMLAYLIYRQHARTAPMLFDIGPQGVRRQEGPRMSGRERVRVRLAERMAKRDVQ